LYADFIIESELDSERKENIMKEHISREQALELLQAYNKDAFHIQHGLTVEGVMRWYANKLGYTEDEDFWGIVGLLHDIDFEQYPDQHCIKAPELLREAGVGEDMIHAICSHGYELTVDIKPEHEMEKVLYATDELTGLIGAAALMRPSKSVQDMELKSLKKKYKSNGFAAGCSREVIERGAELMQVELNDLLQDTIYAMRSSEESVREEMNRLGLE
jgi:predicted hydrolase (HD superfamily)